jgi:hypothetical protein
VIEDFLGLMENARNALRNVIVREKLPVDVILSWMRMIKILFYSTPAEMF